MYRGKQWATTADSQGLVGWGEDLQLTLVKTVPISVIEIDHFILVMF